MNLHFYKYQGTGNDFIIIDNRGRSLEKNLSTATIAKLCDRRFGIGADGLILLSDSQEQDFRMIYYNSDGRESSMCGNGGRCIVSFANKLGAVAASCVFDAIDGLHEAEIKDNLVKLKMGKPQGFQALANQQVWLDTGSPHYVSFEDQPIAELDVYSKGKEVRNSPPFQEQGTNVNFVNVLGVRHLKVRTYERGVEAETLSCGTGVTASAYAYLQLQAKSTYDTIRVDTPGGQLSVEIQAQGTTEEAVLSLIHI